MKRTLTLLFLSSLLLTACDSGAPTETEVAGQSVGPELVRMLDEARYDEVVAQLSGGGAAKTLDAEGFLMLAKARLGKDQVPKAVRALRDGLELHPGDLDQSILLARIYQSLGQLSKAHEVLTQAAAAGAESSEYFMELGVVQGRLQQLEEARASFERARELGAGEADVEFNLGVILAASGDHTRAIGQFEKALAAAPERAYVQRELASSLFHELPGDRERAEQVMAVLDGVLEDSPEDWRAWKLMGECELALEDPVAAQAYLLKALEFSHNEPSVEDLYRRAALEARDLLQQEGVLDPAARPQRGGPPIPVSMQEKLKAAQRKSEEQAASGDSPD